MTLEQLADEDVYEGQIKEDVEEQEFKCDGVFRVNLQSSQRTLEMLNIGGLTLDVAYINARLTVEGEVKAWTEDQANDFWWEQMREKKKEIQEELDEAGVDTTVERISDETWVRLNN